MIDNFNYLHNFRLIYNLRFSYVHLFDDCVLNSFNDGFFDVFSDNFDNLLDDRDFDDFLHFDRNLFDDLDDFFDDDFDGLDNFLSDNFFSDDFDLSDLDFLVDNFDYFLYDCWYFNNFLYFPDDWHNLLNDTINRFVDSFDVIVNFECLAIFDCGDYLFNNALNNFNPDFFDYFLNYSIFVDWHFDNFLYDSFHWHNLFPYHLNLLWLLLNVIDHSFNLNDSLHFDNFFNDGWNFNHFWYFLSQVNDLLHNCRYLNHLMNNLLQRNNFLNNLNLNSWNLKWNMHDLLYFNELLHLNNSFDLFCNGNQNWDLNLFFYNFFDDFLDLLDFLYWLENS